ncbi:MAG: carbamoyl-phosphate synthase large subunit [Thermoplasmata archaeon]
MPRDHNIKNILLIGSGPIVIGQAAEFDYSGTQACRAFKEENCKVVVLNPNPATIQTELEFADSVYLEPIKMETLEKIIEKEKIDSIASGFGGQIALNAVHELGEAGILKKYNVKIIGTGKESIDIAEDREKFREFLSSIEEPVAIGFNCKSMADIKTAEEKIGNFPMIIRSSFTLGGAGTGIAYNGEELKKISSEGLMISPLHEIIIEQSLLNLQEFEIELIRDSKGNKIAVCSMENLDPMGIHTGESIVVTPSLTLSDENYQRLRNSAFKIIEGLKIIGSCNIQFAFNPKTEEYFVVEVNPRTSRSSALASKATGYPIARIAAKIALGYTLDEIRNPVTGNTYAAFEPAIDYVAVKIPRWPFEKFKNAERKIGMSMKSTGEVMGIGKIFEEALMKAIFSLDKNYYSLFTLEVSESELKNLLNVPTDIRLFAIAESIKRNFDLEKISELTGWHMFFLNKIKNIVEIEEKLKIMHDKETIKRAKELGISDKFISKMMKIDERKFRKMKKEYNIIPIFKAIDTCAGEFDAVTPYYYSTYNGEENESKTVERGIIVLGSGPIRIGQGIEFDYSTVEAVLYLKESGFKSIVINNNPETVSTDFDLPDKLYFEPLTFEHVSNVIDNEKPYGIIVQFGGQTSINLVDALSNEFGEEIILGTRPYFINMLEDRNEFAKFLEENDKKRAPSIVITNMENFNDFSSKVGYPLLIRPSYIIGGSGMSIIYNENDFKNYLTDNKLSNEFPILVEKFIDNAIEIDVDAISDGSNVHIMGILEHLEEAGIHSGDSTMVYPTVNIKNDVLKKIIDDVKDLTLKSNILGFVNYQLMVKNDEIIFIEANPRASRTVPFISKANNIPYAKLGTSLMLGKKLKDVDLKVNGRYYVKLSVFPFNRLKGADPVLGPEMKSTGEVMGIGKNFNEALFKAFISVYKINKKSVLLSLNDDDKKKLDFLDYIKDWEIYATPGTYRCLKEKGLESKIVYKISDNREPNILDIIRKNGIGIVINTPGKSYRSFGDGYYIRREAIDNNIPVITNIKLARNIFMSISEEYDLYPLKKS